jgi:type VI secretion system protein ImpJ
MGQALLPAHLRAQEEAILADSALRFNLQEAPSYGLYRLAWNETLLKEGVLSLEELTLVMPSGLLLQLPENARITPLNLNVSGGTLLPVYLHVRRVPENTDSLSKDKATIVRNQVNCWLWSLELSSEQENPDTLESFRLAEFIKLPDGLWQLSTHYIPPLAALGAVPYLKTELTLLSRRLEAYHYQLTKEIAAIYLAGDDLINAKQSLKSVINLQRFLTNLFTQIHPHPYRVLEKLTDFYVDLCFCHDKTTALVTAPYRHEHLAEVFAQILEPIQELIQFNQIRSPYLPFNLVSGIVQATLPEAIREAKDIYLLVQKNTISKAINLDKLKIAAISRIPLVHKFFLQGIPFRRIERPPFQHSFGPEIDIYHLDSGDEWDFALKELSMGFYADPDLAQENFFLHWRSA